MKKDLNISPDLTQILTKAIGEKIYGSVEIYFEEGKITQITQRIIKKVGNFKPKQKPVFKKEQPNFSKNLSKKIPKEEISAPTRIA